jgi:DNA-binding transcriptional LysR family regulator
MDEQKVSELWGHLYWLSVLAQHDSYTAAAAQLGVSKAAMSQHIAHLEQMAGVPLVRRTTRSMQLTAAGQRLVEETSSSFTTIAQSFASVRDLAEQPRGLLRVTAPVAFARQHLAPLVAGFLAKYPELRLELDLSDRLNSLAAEGFDLAIRHTAQPPDTHVAWQLCQVRTVLVASPDYLRRRGTPSTPDDLSGHSCLCYPRRPGHMAWSFRRHCAKSSGRRVTVPVSGAVSANNSEVLREAALTDLGIAQLPDFSAQASLRAGALISVLPDWQAVGSFADTLYAIRPHSAQVPRAVSLFVAYLREAFATGFGFQNRADP